MAEDDAVKHIRPRFTVTVTESPKFDLLSYISNYKGRTVFRRLYLIASCSVPLRDEAARLALKVAMSGLDIDHYNDAVALIKSINADKDIKDPTDPTWLAQREKQNAAETKRLENELKQYKNNLIRESIRMGSEDLGQHYHSLGELGKAQSAFSKMRDYCTTSAHITSTASRTISVAIEQRNWIGVLSQINKIRGLNMKQEELARIQPKTSAAEGIAYMCQGQYREAANAFLSTDISLGDTYNDVISSNDVAVYGGLCALASMSRADLRAKVLDNNSFRSFLELEPHIRRAINFFCASKYSQSLEILELYRADYLLDIYLQDQVPAIYAQIRTKSIVQYFSPFSRVTLKSMEEMFAPQTASESTNGVTNGTDSVATSILSSSFQKELISMIQSGDLDARIDLEKNVLIAYEEDPRAVAQQEALDTVDNFLREARLKLMRLNVINAGLEIKPVPKNVKGKDVAGGGMDLAGVIDAANGNTSAFSGQGYSLNRGRG